MDRIGQLAWVLPRAAILPVVVGVAAAVLILLGPTLYLRDREPFDRLLELLELVLGRSRPARREPLAAPARQGPGTQRCNRLRPK